MNSDTLKDVEGEVILCTRCRLANARLHPVPGEGAETPTVMLIGEAPGREEDRNGRPFVGRAGEILNGLLSTAGLKRDEVYITSVIKCRPPDNRLPRRDEVTICLPYLKRQIALLRPKIVVPMGNVATDAVGELHRTSLGPIGTVHGIAVTVPAPWGSTILFPTYHPAAMTHNPRTKDLLEQDFSNLKDVLRTGAGDTRH